MSCIDEPSDDIFWDWYDNLDLDILIGTLEKEGYTVIPPEE